MALEALAVQTLRQVVSDSHRVAVRVATGLAIFGS
jgi:hypothetical protein